MGHDFTWKKEKLKSRKRIERVFKEGKSFSLFPFRVYFLLETPAPASLPPVTPAAPPASTTTLNPSLVPNRGATPPPRGPLQAGFGATRRNFKKAVDRNRIKRLSREGYRLQKEPLLRKLQEKGLTMAVFFIYTGRELPDYPTVTEKIGVALHKLIKEIR